MKTNNLLMALIAVILITSNLVLSQTQLFKDDFNASPLDVTNKWRRGDNSTTAVTIANGSLQVIPPNGEAGWVVTQDAFPLSNTTIAVKILKANKDCNIGVCPSYPKLSNTLGIYSEASWYRFYIGRDNASDPDAHPYKLYAYKKKEGGSPQSLATFVLPSPYGSEGNPFHIRLRFDTSQIYFEYSTNNGSTWSTMYQEFFDLLPGYSLNNAFHGEINATSFTNSGSFKVDDFEVVSNSSTPMLARIILDDPLNNATFVNRKDDSNNLGFKVMRWNEGSNADFMAAGWEPNPAAPAGNGDLVHYDLRRYIEKGVLEVDVTQFQPQFQNDQNPDRPRHHVLAMFRMPWGGHHVVENLETIWDFHTGAESDFENGIKFYTHTYDNNGDLDLFFAGDGGNGPLVRLYKNNHPSTNTPPTVPTNLSVGISAVNDEITLTWDKSSDDQTTAQNILTYNVMVGKNSGGFDIVSPLSVPGTGKRMLPAVGNAGTNNSFIIKYSSLSAGTYYWKVQAIDNLYAGSAFSSEETFTKGGSAKIAEADSVAETESVAETPSAIPQEFALSQNYPNPFNPSTRLNLNLPENGRVVAVVHDLWGREVVRLHDAEMTAGYKFLDWDGRNAAGTVVSSGTYIVKVRFEGATGMRKEVSSRILLLK